MTGQQDKLLVKSYETREEMGMAAAKDAADAILNTMKHKQIIRMIFAAAPSQDEFLRTLASDSRIDFSRIEAFHMDEYINLPKEAPQAFGQFLRDRLFSKQPFHQVHYINGLAEDIARECIRYGDLLGEAPIDIVCMGIGENGHIAFNDPPITDFNDPLPVKPVKLDPVCRQQQVNDGCFESLQQVPTHAITLTIPTLIQAGTVFCIVPGKLKAEAVFHTLTDEIDERCPATILRRVAGAVLYLDGESASIYEQHQN